MDTIRLTLLSGVLALFIVAATPAAASPDMHEYESGWIGTIPDTKAFTLEVKVQQLAHGGYSLAITNSKFHLERDCQLSDSGLVEVSLGDSIGFTGRFDSSRTRLNGFFTAGMSRYHVPFRRESEGQYVGQWHLLYQAEFNPDFLLSIEECRADQYAAYAIFGDPRVPQCMNHEFKRRGDTLQFRDGRTGLRFSMLLATDTMILNVFLADYRVASIPLTRATSRWEPDNHFALPKFDTIEPPMLSDGWSVAPLTKQAFRAEYLEMLVDSIRLDVVTNIHSLVIARHGRLLFECYGSGYGPTVLHDTRSASKTFTSAIVGIALGDGKLRGLDQQMYDLLPRELQTIERPDSRKARITVRDLLTMRSGIDAVDFGTDRQSPASEDSYQQTGNWAKTILDAPMLNDPGTHSLYGSANPYLLGAILEEATQQHLDLYFDEQIFEPLGVTRYVLQSDCCGRTYTAGGLYLSARDLLKLGQLYLDRGRWHGRQVVPEAWVDSSLSTWNILENRSDKIEYGFLWWRRIYHVGEKKYESIEAHGAGGQYLFVVPELELVVVVMSGNFRNGRFWQPEKIMEDYILPAARE
jgi:CubicO group peptidase (beta-lactamase class C family)